MIAGDNYIIKQKLRLITEKSRTCIIRDLGMLQKNYPGIATSVKTRSKSFDQNWEFCDLKKTVFSYNFLNTDNSNGTTHAKFDF